MWIFIAAMVAMNIHMHRFWVTVGVQCSAMYLLLLLLFFADTALSVNENAGKPTLPTLLKYPPGCSNHCVNIPVSIGPKYWQLGILLLNDDTGQVVDSIVHEYWRDAELINLKILQKWITGVGQPVSWDILIQILNDIKLIELAREVKKYYK